MKTPQNILITGGGGYLGSVMVPMLLASGHQITVIDRFFWGKKTLNPHLENKNLSLIEEDTRSYGLHHFKGIDAVVDLAALSNDPTGELYPQKTLDINYHARVKTAERAKSMGIKKYILASSCSVYGLQDGLMDETSEPRPITTYGKANRMAEQGVLPLSDQNFSVTVLRYGSLFGISPRMRFDLVLNEMTLSLFRNKAITVEGGQKWRPILHVADAADAFIAVLASESQRVNGHIFNAGSSVQNYQISALAELTRSAVDSTATVHTKEDSNDLRSFRISCEKMRTHLGYEPKRSPEAGVREIYQALRNNQTTDTLQTRTIGWYKHLLAKNPELL